MKSPAAADASLPCTAARVGDRHAIRIQFGGEFCESLLPPRPALAEACRRAAAEFGGLSLVTPPVGDAALARLRGHLELLAEQPGPIEVIVNDWGVLQLVRETSPRLEPVLGRLLNRMLRDPRVTPLLGEADLPPAALEVTRQSALTSPSYVALLRRHGVERVELDNLYQGIEIDFAALGLRPSLHLPFGMVASGPACFFAAVHRPRTEKFRNDTLCQLECQSLIGWMTDPSARSGAEPLWAQGNTVFYRQGRAEIDRGLAWARAHRARVVVRRTPLGEGFATDDVEQARRWLEEEHG